MSTNPAAQSSESGPESGPDPNRAAPTPARNVVDFREGPAAAGGDTPQRAIREAVSSRTWQLVTLLIPILLTTWLTYWMSQKEANIKQDIDKQSQMFSQQLQLSEELYKRRFDSYEKLYVELTHLNETLDPYTKGAAESKTNADRAVKLKELFDLSKLHMSLKVENLTGDAWLAAAREDGPLLSGRIEELRAAMKTELDNWMLEKGPPAADSTAAKPKKSKLQIRSTQ